jgi:hypothetical protein
MDSRYLTPNQKLSRDGTLHAAGSVLASFLGALVRGLRWLIYGILVTLEGPVNFVLLWTGIILAATTGFLALVHPGHFPFLLACILIVLCFLARVLYYAGLYLVKPDGGH